MQTPWAILLCKFKDEDSEPYTRQRYEELFTNSGVGQFNMVDFFRDMSHGELDLSGSQVFGWFSLSKNRSEYTGSGVNQQGRADLITWARQAAKDHDVDLSGFFSVVVCMNVPTDLFSGGGGVVCDDGRSSVNGMSSLSPSMLGQEMGHAYGLEHSRADGSIEEYMDRWDVMSTAGFALMGAHPNFTDLDVRARPVFLLGPGLNAANMWSQGWLDMTRVWSAGLQQFGTTVQLRPLHHRDLPGYLAARIGEYFFEFRVPERWDTGIGPAVVLVHTFIGGTSYVYAGSSGNQGLTVGDKFEVGDAADPTGLSSLLQVEVTGIDAGARTATLGVTLRPDRHPKAGPGQILGGVNSDGAVLMIVGGKVIRIPPRSPLLHMLEDLVTLHESESVRHAAARALLQQDALHNISALANVQLQRMTSFRQPAPPRIEQTYESDQM